MSKRPSSRRSSRDCSNGTSFAAGFIAGLGLICIVAVALAGGCNYSSSSGPTKTVSTIKLLLGLLLLFAAFRQWRARPKQGEEPKMPKWLASIDQFTPAVFRDRRGPLDRQPEELRHVARRGTIDSTSRPADRPGDGHDRHLRCCSRARRSSGPLVVYLATGQRATEILGGWRTWLADNNATMMSVLLLVFAVVLIGKGISGLSG